MRLQTITVLSLVGTAGSFGCEGSDPVIPPLEMQFETMALEGGVQGENYNATLEASGGTEEGYRWTVSSGSLPDGLTLRANGTPSTRLSGTPEAAGTFDFTVEVKDSRETTASQSFTVEIAAPPPDLTLTTTDVPNGGTDVEYMAEIVASGGTEMGYRWRVSQGGLPAGLTLAQNGTPSTMITGTPPAGSDGDYEFSITVTDSDNNVATQAFSMNVQNNVVPLNIIASDVPDGEENIEYSATIEAEGGNGAYTWRVQGGEIPPGLTLDPGGAGTTTTLEGTPTMPGNFTFQVEVRDEEGENARKTIFMNVAAEPPPVRIVTSEIPVAEENAPYEAIVRAINGTEMGYTWSIDEGALPAGLTIGATSPAGSQETTISGTPTEFGRFDFTIVVTDSRGNQDDQQITMEVRQEIIPIQIVGDTNGTIILPNAVGGEQYSATIAAQDGFGNYNWVAAGLPAGIRLEVPGTPSTTFGGLPQELGTFTGTVTVYDLNNETDSVQVQITVDPPATLPTIETSAIPNAPMCGAYAQRITGSGGSNANYTWSIVGGALPPNFTIDPNGTPGTTIRGTTGTQTGSYSFTVQLTDTFGLTDTQTYGIDITNEPGGFRFAMHMGDVETSSFNQIYLNEVCGSPSTTPIDLTVPTAPSGGDVWTSNHFVAAFSPNGESLAYVADFTVDNQYDVYVVDLRSGAPTTPRIVSDGLGFSGSLSAQYLKYSNDGTKLSFIADATASSAEELFVVDLTDPSMPGQAVRVSQQMTTSGAEVVLYDWQFSPDGTKIVYEADPTSSDQRHWFVDLSALPSGGAPSQPMVIHEPGYASADVNGIFQWTPDSRAIIYNADFSGTTSEDNFYWVDLSGPTPGTPMQLNVALPANADCYSSSGTDFGYGWSISPDGTKVVILCEMELDNARWPYIVDISGTFPGEPMRAIDLSPLAGRYVDKVRWSPDSTHIVFYGDLVTASGAEELFMADVSGPLPAPTQLIAPAVSTGQEMYTSPYHFAAFSPDMTKVFFIGDFATDGYYELWQVDISNGAPYQRVRVHPPFTQSSQDVYHFRISPDGNKIGVFVYENSAYNLFVADISGPVPTGWARAHSTPVSSTGDLISTQTTTWSGGWSWFWTPDSQSMIFAGAFGTAGADEMWISDVSGAPPYVEQRLSVPNSNTSLDVMRTWAQGEYALPWQFQRP